MSEYGIPKKRIGTSFAVATACFLSALLIAAPGAARVLPEDVATELEQRSSNFVQSSDAEVVQLELDSGWYTEERFPGPSAASVFRPDSKLDAVTKSILLVESMEPELPHARYRVAYRFERSSADPSATRKYVEVARFNLGPARRADVVEAHGDHAASAEHFGLGPDVVWRFVMTAIQGMAAHPTHASRRQLSRRQALEFDCLGVSCLGLDEPQGPGGEWRALPSSAAARAVPYNDRDGDLPGAARVADDLVWTATAEGKEEALPPLSSDPNMVMVISSNVAGQEDNVAALLRQNQIRDDSVLEIWTRRRELPGAKEDWSQLVISRERPMGRSGENP